MSTMWLGWGVAMIVIFFVPTWHWIEKFRHREWWEGYIEKDTKQGKKTLTRKMEMIGELKSCEWIEEEQRYAFYFSKAGKKKTYYSLVSKDDLKSDWLIKRYMIVLYLMDVVIFEQKLEREEWYEREREPKLFWKVYLAFNSLFHFGVSMIAGSGLLGIISAGMRGFTANDSFQYFIYGFVAGIIISIINSYLQNIGAIKIKNRKEQVKIEEWIEPIESNYQVIDIYQVKVIRREMQEKADGIAEIEEIKEHITVYGYNKLADLVLDPQIEVKKWKQIDIIEKKITIAEQKRSRRSFLARSRYLWQMIQGSRKNIARLQYQIRNLHEQMDFVEANKDREVATLMSKILAERDKNRETLKRMIAKVYTLQMIEPTWETVVKEALREIETEKEEKKTEKMDKMILALDKVCEKLSEKHNIDLSEISTIFEKSEGLEKLLGEEANV